MGADPPPSRGGGDAADASTSSRAASASSSSSSLSSFFSSTAIAGGVSGVAARAVTHPFDTVKTRMQLRGVALASHRHASALAAIASIARLEGIPGFYRGFGAVLTGVPFASGAYFVGYEAARAIAPPSLVGATPSYALAGMVAQALASVVYTPVDVVKERLQAREALGSAGAVASYRGTADAYRTIVKNEVRSISHWSPYDHVAVVNADP